MSRVVGRAARDGSAARAQALTEGIHTREALDLVREHVRGIMGQAAMAFSNAMVKMSRLQAAQARSYTCAGAQQPVLQNVQQGTPCGVATLKRSRGIEGLTSVNPQAVCCFIHVPCRRFWTHQTDPPNFQCCNKC